MHPPLSLFPRQLTSFCLSFGLCEIGSVLSATAQLHRCPAGNAAATDPPKYFVTFFGQGEKRGERRDIEKCRGWSIWIRWANEVGSGPPTVISMGNHRWKDVTAFVVVDLSISILVVLALVRVRWWEPPPPNRWPPMHFLCCCRCWCCGGCCYGQFCP